MPNQEYEVPLLPMGFIVKINILSNHGDQHYVGLNGINIIDHMGNNLMDTSINKENYPQVFADPYAVKDL